MRGHSSEFYPVVEYSFTLLLIVLPDHCLEAKHIQVFTNTIGSMALLPTFYSRKFAVLFATYDFSKY